MLHHIEIYVSDLVKSRDFYDFLLKRLGYHLYQEWAEGFSYRKQEHYLVFVATARDYRSYGYHRKRTGLNHLAFWVDSRADLDDWRKECQKRDISLLYDEDYPHAGGADSYALYLEDPDRIKVELVARRKKV